MGRTQYAVLFDMAVSHRYNDRVCIYPVDHHLRCCPITTSNGHPRHRFVLAHSVYDFDETHGRTKALLVIASITFFGIRFGHKRTLLMI